MKRNIILIYLMFTFMLMIQAQVLRSQNNWTNYSYQSEITAGNPLKGIIKSYNYEEYPNLWETTIPVSLEGVCIPLNLLMDSIDSFTFYNLDTILERISSRHRQTLVRVYLDWPGTGPATWPDSLTPYGNIKYGMPPFLENPPYNVTYNTYPTYAGGGLSPDYTNDSLFSALVNFIEAFGNRYDGDPRIGYIQLGLLGHWGEWHTGANPGWFPSTEKELLIFNAYEAAFDHTLLQTRYPDTLNTSLNLGYHDDSFCWATLHHGSPSTYDWFYQTQLENAGTVDKWQQHSIGAEIRPEISDYLFRYASYAEWTNAYIQDGNTFAPGAPQPFEECVLETHPSFFYCNKVLWHSDYAFDTDSNRNARVNKASRSVGYEFFLKEASVSFLDSTTCRIEVEIENTGVAPLYYPWPIQAGFLFNGSNLWIDSTEVSPFLLQPDSVGRYIIQSTMPIIPQDSILVMLRISNPMEGGYPIKFANLNQDRDINGWLTLGKAAYQPGNNGWQSLNLPNIKIYPNPATKDFFIEIYPKPSYFQVFVYDAKGTLLSKLENVHHISTQDFGPGVYFIKIQTSKNSVVKKLLIY